jgi:hypothetical protein
MEFKFYSERDTEYKVMKLYAQLYHDAEPWVIFPPRKFSSKYNAAVDERLVNAVNKAAHARDIGLHMMTRVGSTHTDGQEVIQRSSNINQQSEAVQLIAERMKRRHQSSKSDSNNDNRNQKKKFSPTHICDIFNCDQHALERTCKESASCKTKFRYCNTHSAHSIHSKEKKKVQREKIPEQNVVTSAVVSSDVNVSNTIQLPVVEMVLDESEPVRVNEFQDFQHITEHLIYWYGFIGRDGIDLDWVKYHSKLGTDQELLELIEYDLENISLFTLACPIDSHPDAWKSNLIEAKERVIFKMKNTEAPIIALPEESSTVIPAIDESNNNHENVAFVEMSQLDLLKMNKFQDILNSIIEATSLKPETLQERLLNDLKYPDYVYGMRHFYNQWFSEKWDGNARGPKLDKLVQSFVVEFMKRRTS